MMNEPTIPLACFRAMVEAIVAYVPVYQRENARAAAVAVGIGFEPRRRPRVLTEKKAAEPVEIGQ